MSIEIITIILFGSMILFLVLGHPVAFSLGGIAAVFTLFLWSPEALLTIPITIWKGMTGFTLIALPLFIYMANMLERSGVADDLYEMMYRWLGAVRGGLAVGTVLICTLVAAMSATSGAATVSMGLIALPSMLKRDYDKQIAIGCISAGGALGLLIPPSIIMIILGLMGNLSVGKLFAGGIFPGLLFSFLFIAYILIRSFFQRDLAPALPPEERVGWREKLASLRAVILPVLLVIGVLGSIFAGMATPSEAAGIGALGSILCAAIYRRLNWQTFKEAGYASLRLTGMVMWIYFGAIAFSVIYAALGASELLEGILMGLPGGRWGALAGMLATFLVLGCLMDAFGIIAICAPLYFPIIRSLGFDPLWFGILWVLTVEIAHLTPPFGFNLFYMKGVVPKGITIMDIYRSIVPFVGLQLVGLIIVIAFPEIAVWLPHVLFGVK